MPNAVHHIQLLTPDREAIVEFLEASLGLVRQLDMDVPLADVGELLGLDGSGGHVRSALFGSGNRGLVEVIEWGEAPSRSGDDLVVAGVQLAFAVDDLERCLADARRLGASAVVGPSAMRMMGVELSIATFALGGVRFQLSEQPSHPQDPSAPTKTPAEPRKN
ncbi:Glyoxalase/bleomycin resistance protein/dioxygenase [Mycolicibacterium rhodesiae JS60]|nr:Glyoxalase/bleomycin resistance protein/dioxygenase [Mycolicibacterium rhodesiae JS60]